MQNLVQGPRNKSVHTQTFELLVKMMIHAPDTVAFSVKKTVYWGRDQLIAQVGKQTINITELLSKVNFNHLSFNSHDSQVYMYQHAPYGYRKNPLHTKYQDLSAAEKSALTAYTGSSFFDVNALLHQKYHLFRDTNRVLMTAAFVGSGLNKIPREPTEAKYYRGEYSTSAEEVASRKQIMKSGGYTQEAAFKSTSENYHTAKDFAGNNVLIQYHESTGKDLTELSYYPHESEYLLNVEKVLWEQYEYEDNTHVFHARIVNPLDPDQDKSTPADEKQLCTLIHFANKQGIDASFVTPCTQAILGLKGADLEKPKTVLEQFNTLVAKQGVFNQYLKTNSCASEHQQEMLSSNLSNTKRCLEVYTQNR